MEKWEGADVPFTTGNALSWRSFEADWQLRRHVHPAREPGWALAEGEVGGADGAQTHVLVANTAFTAASVSVTLLFEDRARAQPFWSAGTNALATRLP